MGSKVDEDEGKQLGDLSKTLKEGERILAPTRRPDGTLRKPIRIRAGYVPQDEVAIYQSKGAIWKKEKASQVGPPGYDPALDAKPKTKSVKRNERKKEKRLQSALEKEKNIEPTVAEDGKKQEVVPINNSGHTSESVNSLTSQINELAVSGNSSIVNPTSDSVEGSAQIGPGPDVDKRIRALKKKPLSSTTIVAGTSHIADDDLQPPLPVSVPRPLPPPESFNHCCCRRPPTTFADPQPQLLLKSLDHRHYRSPYSIIVAGVLIASLPPESFDHRHRRRPPITIVSDPQPSPNHRCHWSLLTIVATGVFQ